MLEISGQNKALFQPSYAKEAAERHTDSFYTHDARMTVHIQRVSYYELAVRSVTNIFTHLKQQSFFFFFFGMIFKAPTITQNRAMWPGSVFPVWNAWDCWRDKSLLLLSVFCVHLFLAAAKCNDHTHSEAHSEKNTSLSLFVRKINLFQSCRRKFFYHFVLTVLC